MDIITLLLLAVGLSMDAFAVAISNGITQQKNTLKTALFSGLAFGLFQGLMPLIGYWAGFMFSDIIEKYDHIIALVLLAFIGIKMIVESVDEILHPKTETNLQDISLKLLFTQAVATSIDALAVGVSFAAIKVNIFFAVSFIAVTTFIFSFLGVMIGKGVGKKLKEKAGIAGGIILCAIGIKIFVEHVFF